MWGVGWVAESVSGGGFVCLFPILPQLIWKVMESLSVCNKGCAVSPSAAHRTAGEWAPGGRMAVASFCYPPRSEQGGGAAAAQVQRAQQRRKQRFVVGGQSGRVHGIHSG